MSRRLPFLQENAPAQRLYKWVQVRTRKWGGIQCIMMIITIASGSTMTMNTTRRTDIAGVGMTTLITITRSPGKSRRWRG